MGKHGIRSRCASTRSCAAEKAASQAKAAAKKANAPRALGRRGRPQGSKHTSKAAVPLTPELSRIAGMLVAVLPQITGCIPLRYLGLDGHCGNPPALHLARQGDLHLISKLRCDAALYLPYTGPYAGRGPRRKYGAKLAYDHLPLQYLQETTVERHMPPQVSQRQLLHREVAHPLNVVIIVQPNLRTQARAHIVLFSSDLTLAYTLLVDYYALRCQREFHFRHAKQYWGLEDCMHGTPPGVTNAANLSLFRVNVAYHLRQTLPPCAPAYRGLDLKADCRGYKYVEETIKMLPNKPEPILLAKILHKVTGLGRIHVVQPSFSFS